jgi:hypothetical protein
MSKPIKARVLVAFTDRENIMNVYQVGDTFEGAAGRVDELVAGGYVEAVEAAKKEPKKER